MYDAEAHSLVLNTVITLCVADGELYAGTVSNFQGNEPIIYKSLSQGTSLKTENSLNWLQGTSLWLEGKYLIIIKMIYIYHLISKTICVTYAVCELTIRVYVKASMQLNTIW